MTQHAIVFIDHDHAKIFHVDAADPQGAVLKQTANHKVAARHKTDGKAAHDQQHFDAVIAGLKEVSEILIVGPGTAKTELMHHIENTAKALVPRVVGVEPVDHPTDKQLIALAKNRFKAIDQWR